MQTQGSKPGPDQVLGPPENGPRRFSVGPGHRVLITEDVLRTCYRHCCPLLWSLLGWLSLILPHQVTRIGAVTVQGFSPSSRLIFPLTVDALWPPVLDPWVSPPPALFWLQTGSRVPAPKYPNVTNMYTKRALPASCPPLELSCATLPRTTPLQDAQEGAPSHLHSLDFREEKGRRPHPSSGLPARAPSQAPKSCPCALPPQGDTTPPTQRPLRVRLAIAQAWAHSSGQSGAPAQFIGSEIHSDSGAQKTRSQEQTLALPVSPERCPAACS